MISMQCLNNKTDVDDIEDNADFEDNAHIEDIVEIMDKGETNDYAQARFKYNGNC